MAFPELVKDSRCYASNKKAELFGYNVMATSKHVPEKICVSKDDGKGNTTESKIIGFQGQFTAKELLDGIHAGNAEGSTLTLVRQIDAYPEFIASSWDLSSMESALTTRLIDLRIAALGGVLHDNEEMRNLFFMAFPSFDSLISELSDSTDSVVIRVPKIAEDGNKLGEAFNSYVAYMTNGSDLGKTICLDNMINFDRELTEAIIIPMKIALSAKAYVSKRKYGRNFPGLDYYFFKIEAKVPSKRKKQDILSISVATFIPSTAIVMCDEIRKTIPNCDFGDLEDDMLVQALK